VYQTLMIVPAAALMLAGCRGGNEQNPAAASNPGDAKVVEASAIMVTTAPVILKDIDKTVDITGNLVAFQDVVVGSKMPGRIAFVNFREGDSVAAGQVVAQIDDTDFRAQVTQAQANLLSARVREDQARAQLRQAEISVEQSRTALRQAETNLEWTRKTTGTAVAVAKSNLQTAQERLKVVRTGAREQERQQAEQAVRAARANLNRARADLTRYKQLFKEQAISASQLDQAEATAESAEANYNSAQQALSLIQEGARKEDIRTAELAVQQAQEGLSRAEADLDMVRLRENDVRNARSAVSLALNGVETAKAGIAQAQAGVQQAKAALQIAQESLNNTRIISPMYGYVAQRMAEPGQQIGGGGMVMRIVAPNSIYFQATISESEFSQVRPGQSTSISVDAFPGTKFNGTVTSILPVASNAARSFTVRVDFKVADRRLRPQMFARGSILIDTHRGAVLVPKDAVLFDPVNNRTRVFVAKGGNLAEERQVSVGYSNPQYVEILSGVQESEKVIVVGQNGLQNGDRIKVQ
jgi:RND family efflux transporter MFP subunit